MAFQLSVFLCFLMVGIWLWYCRRPSFARAVLFLVACFAAYFAQLLGFACAVVILALYELTRPDWREWLQLACFLAPPSLLAVWARPGLRGHSQVEWQPLGSKLHWLSGMITHGYDKSLDRLLIAGFVLCALVALIGNRDLRVNRRWLTVALMYILIMLACPYHWGETYDVNSRMVPPLCFLSLAVFRIGRRANWIVALALALTALRVFNLASGFERETKRNAAMDRGIEHIARNARIVRIETDRQGVDSLDVYYPFYSDYAVIRRGAISFDLYDIPGQTALRINYPPLAQAVKDQNWKEAASYFDYVWSYDDQSNRTRIETLADKAFEERPLILYKVRKEQ